MRPPSKSTPSAAPSKTRRYIPRSFTPPRGPSRRPEVEDRDLGPTVEAEAGVDHAETPVGVLVHLPHLVEPTRVLVYERGDERVPQTRKQRHDIWGFEERDPDLPAVRVAGELK